MGDIINRMMGIDLKPRFSPGASVIDGDSGVTLRIPQGAGGTYRLAQIDDYSRHRRSRFPRHLPLSLQLCARLSTNDFPGTWGFGLWNDPFGLSLGLGGSASRLPALPQCAWFFYASKENALSFGEAPGNGLFAGTMSSPRIPSCLFFPLLPSLILLPVKRFSRWAHSLAGKAIHQSGAPLRTDATDWHKYRIEISHELCSFFLDDTSVLTTTIIPQTPLGVVIWIDNQYAAWKQDGAIASGTLENPEGWMDVEHLEIYP